MYVPLGIKTDYSLLKSLVRIKDLITFLKNNNYSACGIIDNNLSYVMEFYKECINNNIKPIIGFNIKYNDNDVYLYAKNYRGLQKLFKINTIKEYSTLDIKDLISNDIKIVLPYNSIDLYKEIKGSYLSYSNNNEKKEVSKLATHIVFINEVFSINKNDLEYIDYLNNIGTNNNIYTIEKKEYKNNYILNIEEESTYRFINDINIEIPFNNRYIPKYNDNSKKFLFALAKKGLEKRLNNNIPKIYSERLLYELDVINEMGFNDYFLIVYDYVKYAKNNDILVGPGRGSAAGSLVSYCLGITEVDPIKYNLLFERFLNKDRITMPDIDIDFEYTKRDNVIEYVKNKYGVKYVAPIMTYGTLGTKQVIRDVFKLFDIDEKTTSGVISLIDGNSSIKDNLENSKLQKILKDIKEIKEAFDVIKKLEGLKKYVSIHAAGIIISSVPLDEVIPIIKQDNGLLTGYTMEYLEELGLLKMDFLALKNLTIITNILSCIKKSIRLNEIPLDDKKTFEIFSSGNTEGVFQFETDGMKNFVVKLKPTCFDDLIASVALFRPGPKNNIDSFINRKNGKENISYLDETLKPILSNTYGIIIYQEQIIEILKVMAGYTYSEADIIRRAMSKKKVDVMKNEREKFINGSISLGHRKEVAEQVFELILKFAEYGFNKAHSVSYALVGYYLAYLKANYYKEFVLSLLNMSIGSDIKIKEYMDLAKNMDLIIVKPSINLSSEIFIIKDNELILPFNVIKNISTTTTNVLLKERKEKEYTDFFDFVKRVYGKNVNRKTIESLISADAFNCFGFNHYTLMNNIDNAINYAELSKDLDEDLVMKPVMEISDEYDSNYLMNEEFEIFGYYISNHPTTKYNSKSIKINEVSKYYDKSIEIFVLINRINKIKTKNNENMAFVTVEDETGEIECVIFSDSFDSIKDISEKSVVRINALVSKRYDKYQLIIKKINNV